MFFSLTEEEWQGRVTTGAGGLAGVAWGGDSKHVLTLGDWGVLLTVWSLASTSVQYIKTPKEWTCSAHYGSILWHDVGKNPILVGYVVLGIGYGVSAHDLSGYKVLGVLVVDNGPHVKEPLTALLKPIPKS